MAVLARLSAGSRHETAQEFGVYLSENCQGRVGDGAAKLSRVMAGGKRHDTAR